MLLRLGLVFHKQFRVKTKYDLFFFFFYLQFCSNFKHICFVLYTAIAIILHKEHCLEKRKQKTCYQTISVKSL